MMRSCLLFLCAAFMASFVLTGCISSSLPEGAQKPSLEITKAAITEEDGQAVFLIGLTLRHNSLTALPVKSIKVDVFVNESPAASYQQTFTDVVVEPAADLSYEIKVKANLLEKAASSSLALNPMVKVQSSVAVFIVFAENEDEHSFNPSATFEGIIGHVQ